MPVQGWDFEDEVSAYTPGKTTIAVAPFIGRTKMYTVSGPLSESESESRLGELQSLDIVEPQGASRDNHVEKVQTVIDRIRKDDLRKVVIARKELLDIKLNIPKVFKALCSTYPNAIVYVLHLNNELWIGATPETLLTAGEDGLITMSLAGTRKPDGPDFTEKEYDEQLAVTESIEDVLLKLGCSKIDARGPIALNAGPVQHLQTRIEATLPVSGYSIDWAKALHPTPAVCGMPKEEALEIIKEVEKEVIKEVEKIVEVKVPVEKVVTKEVYITDDEQVTELGNKIAKLEKSNKTYSTKLKNANVEKKELEKTLTKLEVLLEEKPKEVIKEVPVEVIKEVIKEIPTEVIKEVIVEKEVEKIVEVTKEIPVDKIVIKEVVKEVPVEKIIEKEVYITDDSKIKELIKKIETLENTPPKVIEKEVVKEVEVEVIKEVEKPIEVIKEVIKEVEKPVEVIKEVIKEVKVVKEVENKDKQKKLQETIKQLRDDIRKKDDNILQLEKNVVELQKVKGPTKGQFMRSSNLNDNLYR